MTMITTWVTSHPRVGENVTVEFDGIKRNFRLRKTCKPDLKKYPTLVIKWAF